VSLIRTEKLKQTNLFYNPNETLTLNGLSANASVNTIGSVILKPQLNNHQLDMKFHIVKENANIPFDGLLGNDFLKKQEAQIDQ
jgi:hypothetical protein